MIAGLTDVIAEGTLPLAACVAVLAGAVSFLSPCVLPLVPGFLGYVTGLGDTRLEDRRTGRMLAGTLLFVLGFTAVFVPLVVLVVTSVSTLLREHRDVLERVGGVVVVLLALVFAGMGTQRQVKVGWRPAAGMAGAPLLGAAFALGWTPCIGPTLGAVMALGSPLDDSATGPLARGAVLGVAYCLGLGLPFLMLAGGYGRLSGTWTALRRHQRALQLGGAGLLLVLGLLMVLGLWQPLVSGVQTRLTELVGTPVL
ncbi:cytochrome c biogenesis CcdA family protein [Arsenicicoccus cauae]|uniref:cytochrome c biogenesis CcdA family protein n=1 Tax=Arsenicicoccus cauae TaxID=2663847 RepID=UPI0028A251CF|nr:cytochrome c biogenesis CcdA family protein [Arsenicicoccus cauae]